MTEYEAEWEALHTTTVVAGSKEEAIKIVKQMADMDESCCCITDGPFVDEIHDEE